MSNRDKFFIEVDCCQHPEKGQLVSGDVYLQRRYRNRIILVLAGGAGSGIQPNVVANVVASMALHYTIIDEGAARTAESIVRTFAGTIQAYNNNRIKFTIVDIHENGLVRLMEFENPPCVLFHDGRATRILHDTYEVSTGDGQCHNVYVSEFRAEAEDRLVFAGDGIVNSGVGTRRMPEGWRQQGVITLVEESIADSPTVSAHHLCRQILGRAEVNDLFTVKNDMSCFSVYFRQPRKILVCSGPPFNEKKDVILADMVAKYDGEVLICGGTTAQIISRELGREVNVQLKRDPAGLPPTSSMEGVALVTEGVLTLSKVRGLLERLQGTDVTGNGTDAEVARMLISHDVIEFEVGTRINPIHQDPNLPVELELRRNLIKGLAALLETKFMKEVRIQFI